MARDLHDGVIQRLFAIGLSLQGLAASPAGRAVARASTPAVADIDETIRQVRATIFELGGAGNGRGIRSHVLALAEELRPVVGFDVPVEFTGAVDTAVTDAVADQLLPTLREALTNIGRTPGPPGPGSACPWSGRYCRMEVTDNGTGLRRRTGPPRAAWGSPTCATGPRASAGRFEVTHPAHGGHHRRVAGPDLHRPADGRCRRSLTVTGTGTKSSTWPAPASLACPLGPGHDGSPARTLEGGSGDDGGVEADRTHRRRDRRVAGRHCRARLGGRAGRLHRRHRRGRRHLAVAHRLRRRADVPRGVRPVRRRRPHRP